MSGPRKFVVLTTSVLCSLSFSENALSSAKAQEPTSCPSKKFTEFRKRFSEDVQLQAAFTKYPLKKLRVDTATSPEPTSIIEYVRRDQIRFPLIDSDAERKHQSLTWKEEITGRNTAQFVVQKPDTDYLIIYFFTKKSCWQLDRIEDWSL